MVVFCSGDCGIFMLKMAEILMEAGPDDCLRKRGAGTFFRKKIAIELFNHALWKQELGYESDDNRGEDAPKMHFMTPTDAIECDLDDYMD